MKILSQILSYSLPFLYLLVIYFYYQIFKGTDKRLISKTTPMLMVLIVIHAAELITRHIALKTIPLSTTHDAFSFLAFSILFVYMMIEMGLQNRGAGLFILAFAFIFELVSTYNINWEPETNPLLQDPAFAIHASVSIMGYTALALSAIFALMYLMQNRNIKKRNLGKLFNQLPALNFLEKMSARSVLIGIVLLGIGILAGHIQAIELVGSFIPKDLKVIITDVIWLFYLVGFIVAKTKKWRGLYMAYLSIFGFAILIVGGTLVMYISDSFHAFY